MSKITKKEDVIYKKRSKLVVFALICVCLAVAFGHMLFPVALGAFVLTGGVWGTLLASICFIGVACLLAFIFTGVGLLLLGVFAFAWTLVVIFLFPFFFPVLVPLLIVLLFISFLRRRSKH